MSSSKQIGREVGRLAGVGDSPNHEAEIPALLVIDVEQIAEVFEVLFECLDLSSGRNTPDEVLGCLGRRFAKALLLEREEKV